MQNILIGVLLALSHPLPAEAKEIVPVPIPEERTVPELIKFYSSKYNVDEEVVTNVIKCESNFLEDAIGDYGTSYGLSQIHLPAHPDITKEQALDKEFAIEFMAKEMSQGNSWMWSCWKKLYRS